MGNERITRRQFFRRTPFVVGTAVAVCGFVDFDRRIARYREIIDKTIPEADSKTKFGARIDLQEQSGEGLFLNIDLLITLLGTGIAISALDINGPRISI